MSIPTSAVRPAQPAPRQNARDGVEVIQPDQYTDRRAEPRAICDARGVLLFPANGEIVACRILDQSMSGARVAFDAINGMPSEIWLIALDQSTARRGTAAWSTGNRMGLKFDFVQQLSAGVARPAKVPQVVFDAWRRMSGNEAPEPEKPADDALYFD